MTEHSSDGSGLPVPAGGRARPPRSRGRVLTFALGSVLVLATAIYLVVSALSAMFVEELPLSTVLGSPAAYAGRPLKIEGRVAKGSIAAERAPALVYRFRLVEKDSGEAGLWVEHAGPVPDALWVEGAVAVVRGTLSADGRLLRSNHVRVRCPSRYEGKTPPAGYRIPADND